MTNRSYQIGTRPGSPVSALTDVDDLFVLRSNFVPGNMYAWGYNFSGLGLGDAINRSSPVQVGSLTNWRSVTASAVNPFSIATKTDGTLWSWGTNSNGELGLGTTATQSSPVQVGLLTNWKRVFIGAIGSSISVIKTDGTLWTWGYNFSGVLGLGDAINRSSPVQVGLLNNWKSVAAGLYHTAATQTDGSLWTWGYNTYGGLGLGDVIYRSSPVQVGLLTNWKSVAAGLYHTAATQTDGSLWTWGYNLHYQLGLGDAIHRSSPVQVGLLTNWQNVLCGDEWNASIKPDGSLWTWGNNDRGQLGLGNLAIKSAPTQVGLLNNWMSVSCGQKHMAAIKTDGTLWVCGYNYNGQLGLGDSYVSTTNTRNRSSPVQVGSLTNWKSVSAGNGHTIAQTYSV